MAAGSLATLLAGDCGGGHDREPAARVYPAGLGRRAVLQIAPAERFNSRDWGGNRCS
jgi:hypothetical protein